MGFSASPTQAIVYEYVSGGSLFNRLHEVASYWIWLFSFCNLTLFITLQLQCYNESDRTRILKTCRGLVYLHSANPPTKWLLDCMLARIAVFVAHWLEEEGKLRYQSLSYEVSSKNSL